MTQLHRITEYLDVDVSSETWRCHRCERVLGPATENYKEYCLVWDRDPCTIYPPTADGHVEGPDAFAPDPDWYRIVEFYCPGCGTLIEAEGLPPGHPITHDIELDLKALRSRVVTADIPAFDTANPGRSDSGTEVPES